MVYNGKPSKACEECRIRRTKCDTKKPSCSQCVRAGRACKGYRDPGEFIFRDESQGLINRRQRAKEAQNQKTSRTSHHDEQPFIAPVLSDVEWAVLRAPPPFFARSLVPSADDQATCFFFQNYVTQPDCLSQGTLEYLADIYGSEEIGSALTDAVSSLGMAGLANFWKAPSINFNARFKYSTAVKTLSSQLRNTKVAKSDQTLIATILLGLYETNTCCSRESMDLWTKHTQGATALLQLRGKEQLRTPIGYRLFLHLRTQIITNCAQRNNKIPPILHQWNKELDFEDTTHAASSVLAGFAMKYCDLRASMSSFVDYSDPQRIIVEACSIDDELDLWAKTCPPEYVYQTITLQERSDEVFSDHYHSYHNIYFAGIWNHYRCIRTLINEIILTQLQHLHDSTAKPNIIEQDIRFSETQIFNSNTTLLQLCHELCASVPYYLNFHPDCVSEASREVPRAVHGNLLLWPLYTAGCTRMVSDVMRAWVGGRLQWISDVLGIRQAAPLAFSVLNKQDSVTWKIEAGDTTHTVHIAAYEINT